MQYFPHIFVCTVHQWKCSSNTLYAVQIRCREEKEKDKNAKHNFDSFRKIAIQLITLYIHISTICNKFVAIKGRYRRVVFCTRINNPELSKMIENANDKQPFRALMSCIRFKQQESKYFYEINYLRQRCSASIHTQ